MKTPSRMIRILAISGSLRKVSSNTALLNAAIVLAPEIVEIKLYGGLGDLPPFNPDLEPYEPPSVTDFKRQLQGADGLLISSPESAHGVPGVLKNALDWLVSGEEFVYKPVALLNASPHATLTEIITVMSGRLVPEASITLPLQRGDRHVKEKNMGSGEKSSSIGTPVSELELDAALVYGLLEEQHPDLAHLPLHLVDAGWDNAMFRLGDHLSVRLPRRKAAATLIENEQIWLPLLADQLPIPVPTPYRLGKPVKGYPWRWSVLPWLVGKTADQEEPNANQAKLLASFMRSLHIPAPFNAPINAVRGVPLHQRASFVEERMQRLETKTNLITQSIKNTWIKALNAPIDVQPTWLHGDLHPRNVLVENGEIAGIIDWGDITSGDRATDLASMWMLFSDSNARQQAIAEYANISEATLQRAKGWAILFGVVLLDTGLIDNPRNTVMGVRTLCSVSED